MPVSFNIAANTQLPDPLIATKGRALRAQTANIEQQTEMAPASEERAQAEEARRHARDERADNEELRQQQEFEQDQQDRAAMQARDFADKSSAAYEAVIAADGSKEDAGKAGAQAVLDAIDVVQPGGADAARTWAKENNVDIENYNYEAAKTLRTPRKDLQPTGKMIEAISMGLKPGTKEWEDYIKGTGKDGKPLAIEVKMQMARDVLNKDGAFDGISDAEQLSYLNVLGVQSGPRGSVTINWETAKSLADNIVDRTEIGENWAGWDDEEFNERLAFSLMRLAKDGQFGGSELVQRALIDALGERWDDMVELLAEEQAKNPEITMDDIIKAAASE